MKFAFRLAPVMSLLCAALLLSGCAETELVSHYWKKASGPSQTADQGGYKVGKPYQVGSVWYYPQENFRMVETGIASWYGPDFHGKKTANGELYNQNELTAAHRTLQMPSFVRVTNLENGRSVVVRINDRGPFAHGRVIDVSKRAADLLGFRGKGTARVRLEVLEQESRRAADAAKQGADPKRMTAEAMRAGTPIPVVSRKITRGPAVASADDDYVPDSLKTPTITVEELNRAGLAAAQRSAPPQPVPTHLGSGGNAMPDPVVTRRPVSPTGIFVQAGAFAVRDNALRLQSKLAPIGPVLVDSIVTSAGRTLYRVRVGPLSSVAEADSVLERVIRAGGDGARVVRGS